MANIPFFIENNILNLIADPIVAINFISVAYNTDKTEIQGRINEDNYAFQASDITSIVITANGNTDSILIGMALQSITTISQQAKVIPTDQLNEAYISLSNEVSAQGFFSSTGNSLCSCITNNSRFPTSAITSSTIKSEGGQCVFKLNINTIPNNIQSIRTIDIYIYGKSNNMINLTCDLLINNNDMINNNLIISNMSPYKWSNINISGIDINYNDFIKSVLVLKADNENNNKGLITISAVYLKIGYI